MEESPFVDYLDGDNGFDFDNADGDMIGSLPGDTPGDSSEKRKSPDDGDDDDDEGGGKRREGEDKQAKKPGRKPLTSEPTTVGFMEHAHVGPTDSRHRSGKPRIARPNELSENAKRST